MSELIKVANCENELRLGDVIFVHGLDGDARSTWRPRDSQGPAWPEWLAEDLPDAGVWLLGYEVPSSAWRGHSMPLSDRATNALALLETEGLGERPIGFVTHSMGGLLTKQLLRHGRDFGDPNWKRIADATRGVVFLSTPHSGSDIAGLVKHLGLVLRNTVSVDELRAHDPRLRELNTWFRNNHKELGVRVEVYCEKVATHGFVVVNEMSADPGIAGVVPVPLDEDHISIAKPASRDTLLYKRTTRFIRECLRGTGLAEPKGPAARVQQQVLAEQRSTVRGVDQEASGGDVRQEVEARRGSSIEGVKQSKS
jgi:pimeloyl-ACP methyl ester carboxylesterase